MGVNMIPISGTMKEMLKTCAHIVGHLKIWKFVKWCDNEGGGESGIRNEILLGNQEVYFRIIFEDSKTSWLKMVMTSKKFIMGDFQIS